MVLQGRSARVGTLIPIQGLFTSKMQVWTFWYVPWVAEPFSKWGAQVHVKKNIKFLRCELATATSQALKYGQGRRNSRRARGQ